MRNLIVHEFISLDGVVQAPGGKDEDRDGGFAHGGWTMKKDQFHLSLQPTLQNTGSIRLNS